MTIINRKYLPKCYSPIHPEIMILADSGYQGLQKIHKNTFLLIKNSKLHHLVVEERNYNKNLSKLRINIEHVFAKLKRFKILVHKYQNKIRRFTLRFNLISGIYNFELI